MKWEAVAFFFFFFGSARASFPAARPGTLTFSCRHVGTCSLRHAVRQRAESFLGSEAAARPAPRTVTTSAVSGGPSGGGVEGATPQLRRCWQVERNFTFSSLFLPRLEVHIIHLRTVDFHWERHMSTIIYI